MSDAAELNVGPTAGIASRRDRLRPIFAAIGLFFLAYPLVAIVATRAAPLETGLALLAMVLFGLTVAGGWLRGRPIVPFLSHQAPLTTLIPIAILAIATALQLLDPGSGTWFGLFYFASTAASRIRPEWRAQVVILGAGLVGLAAHLAIGLTFEDAAYQGLSVAVVGWLVFILATLRHTNQALLAAQEEIARLAVSEERDRIARDLHDVLGHSLSLIAIKSELAGRLLPDDPGRARDEIQDVERAARESLASVRETVGGYRRPSLAAELDGARSALSAAGIAGTVEETAGPLPTAVDTLLAWAVREGVTNVLRHSRASRCTIRTSRQGGAAELAIVDDGPPIAPNPSPGSGLRGLAERLAAVGGRLETGLQPGGGYQLLVRVPLGRAE
jgi:two-component system sensor histidine kinase DesK